MDNRNRINLATYENQKEIIKNQKEALNKLDEISTLLNSGEDKAMLYNMANTLLTKNPEVEKQRFVGDNKVIGLVFKYLCSSTNDYWRELNSFEAILSSTEAINEIINSRQSLLAVGNFIDFREKLATGLSSTDEIVVANCTTLMKAITNSIDIIFATTNTDEFINSFGNSELAMTTIANNEPTMKLIANNKSALSAIANSESALRYITYSEIAMMQLFNVAETTKDDKTLNGKFLIIATKTNNVLGGSKIILADNSTIPHATQLTSKLNSEWFNFIKQYPKVVISFKQAIDSSDYQFKYIELN